MIPPKVRDLVWTRANSCCDHYTITRIKPDESGCWIWTGNMRKSGDAYYGVARSDPTGPRTHAHRHVYELMVEPVPADMTLDHLCKNTRCVNPEHMEIVTRWENVRRSRNHAAENLRRDTCPRGHKYDKVAANGWRRCSKCASALLRARRRGVPLDNRDAVLLRAGKQCEKCGKRTVGSMGTVHHRAPRQMGGTRVESIHACVNLLWLCGHGTVGCHGWIEQNRAESYEKGWLVHQGTDPATVPFLHWSGELRILLPDGTYGEIVWNEAS